MVNASFGMMCLQCRSVTGVLVGGDGTCPDCGGRLVPASGSNAPESLANYQCPKCGSVTGLMVSTGPITACPDCGHPID
jgi:DNA-directed RNA polymerase subunit RPC12/RpoP